MRNLVSLRIAYCFISLAFLSFILNACTKETTSHPPSIQLVMGSGNAPSDTTVGIGQKVNLVIQAEGLDENITYLNVRIDNGSTSSTLLDSGMNSKTLRWAYTIIKSGDPIEKWTVKVMDKNRNTASICFYIRKNAIDIYGNILSCSQVILGAQNNSTYGHFYSLGNQQVFFQDDAAVNQPLIDFIYYYGPYQSTLSSAAETEAPNYYGGSTGVANWTVKNETRYDTAQISSAFFQSSTNDSLILHAYNPVDAKRKAKFITAGTYWSFIDHNGKLGIIEVTDVSPGDTGKIIMNIKRQP